MSVQTVTGQIAAAEMGITLPHEHVLLDLTCTLTKPNDPSLEWIVDAKMSPMVFGDLLHHGLSSKDNLVLDDRELAVRELMLYKKLGGRTLVDLTSRGLSPDPLVLRDISRETGLNIVLGCGYYVAASHPADMGARTVESLSEEMVRDLTQGFDGTDVRSGIIGEIGTSHPVAENERKVLRAAAKAHSSTGASINVHTSHKGEHALEAIKVLESEGVDPVNAIISHMDAEEKLPFEYQRAVAETGAYVEFDCFGEEEYVDEFDYVHPRDLDRVRTIVSLIDKGFIDNVLISQDVCSKIYIREYGGYGYDHILKTIVPMFKRRGVTDDEIGHIMVENPRRAIAR
jgi:phosphotriesterase-related protein